MSKETLLFGLIELIVLLIPVVTLIFRYASWKKEVEMKIEMLQKNDAKQDAYYGQIIEQLNSIQVTLAQFQTAMDYMQKEAQEARAQWKQRP